MGIIEETIRMKKCDWGSAKDIENNQRQVKKCSE